MWKEIQTKEQIDQLVQHSHQQPVLIYKHSTRCSLSTMAKNNMESGFSLLKDHNIDVHYLDLIRFRDVSDYIESHLGVRHESPQVILLQNGEVVQHESHMRIDPEKIVKWTP